jgi:lysophospholipase L1-like esterase
MTRNLLQYHPVIGYQFIPSLKARVDHKGQPSYLVRVNRQGFRSDRDFDVAKPAGKFRVLLFGDSFTAGDGVSNKHRFSDVLEQFLPDVLVENFGLPGTGTDQHYLTYREFGAALEHDLIVIAVQVENINRAYAHYREFADEQGVRRIYAKPYFERGASGELVLRHAPPRKEAIAPEDIPRAEREYVDWPARHARYATVRRFINRLGPHVKALAQRASRYQPLPAYDRADHPKWQLLKAILLKWAGESRTPVLIFTVPLYHYVESSSSAAGYQARFAELNGVLGLALHDALPDLLSYPLEERRGFRLPSGPHPTPLGHRALAMSLAKAIRPFLPSDKAPSTCR